MSDKSLIQDIVETSDGWYWEQSTSLNGLQTSIFHTSNEKYTAVVCSDTPRPGLVSVLVFENSTISEIKQTINDIDNFWNYEIMYAYETHDDALRYVKYLVEEYPQ